MDELQDTQEPSTWDKVDALTEPNQSVWDRVDALGDKPADPTQFTIDQASKRDPKRSARVIRLANKFQFPEQFVDNGTNLETLEEQEKAQQFNTPELINSNPKLAKLISESGTDAATVALQDLPALKKLDLLYNRPVELWPQSDSVIQQKARKDAKIHAEEYWNRDEAMQPFGVDEYGNVRPKAYTSQQQAEEAFYQSAYEFRKAQEEYISGSGQIGAWEALKHKARENPAFWMPFGGDAIDVARMGELYLAAKAQEAKTATPDQVEMLQDYGRLEKAAQFRGTSFMGKLTDSLAGLPAFAGEVALTGGIYNAAEGAVFKGGKKAAELFLKGAFEKALESGFAKSVGKKVLAGAAGSLVTAPIARGMAATAAELKSELDAGEFKSLPEQVKNVFVRSAADMLSVKAVEALSPFSKGIMNAIVKNDSSASLTMVQDQLRKGGISGFLGMVMQGESTKLINAVGGVAPYQTPTGEDLAISALTGGIPHAFALATDLAMGRSQIYKAKLHAEAALSRGQLIRESNSVKDAPAEARAMTDSLSKDSPHEYTYLPVGTFGEYWKNDATLKAKELGISEKAYRNAVASGTDLTVKTSAFDHVIGADKTASEFFANELRSAPDVMNVREGDAWVKRVEARKAAEKDPESARQTIVQQIVDIAHGDKVKEAVMLGRLDEGSETLLSKPEILGLNDDQIVRVSKAIGEAQAHAENVLNEKEIKRRDNLKGDLYRKEAERVRADVETEFDAQKEIIALAHLEKGQTPSGEVLDVSKWPPLKLNRAQVKASRYGKEALKGLPEKVFSDTGVHPDTAAEEFGFNSGEDLLNSMTSFVERRRNLGETRKEIIEGEVQRRMDAKYPKITDPSVLPDEAVKALHNDKASALKRLALEYIVENKLSQFKRANQAALRKLKPMADIRAEAEQDIHSTPQAELDPRKYLTAERQAAREVADRVAKGEMATADGAANIFDAKLQELEAAERYRAAQEAKEQAAKIFSKWEGVPDAALFKKPETVEYGQQVKDLLRRIGVIAVDPRELEGKQPIDAWIKEKEANGDTRLEPIYIDQKFREESFSAHYKDLTYQDIASLNDTIEQITHLARDKGEVMAGLKRVTMESFRERFAASVQAQYEKLPLSGWTKNEKTAIDGLKHTLKILDVLNNRPEAFFEMLDGGKIDGPMSEALFDPYSKAKADALDMRKEFVDAIIKAKKAMPNDVAARLFDRVQIPGLERPLTRRTILGIAMNGGNESNYSKMVRGEMKREGGLTERQIQEAVKLLTEEEKTYVQSTLDAIEGYFPRVDALNKWATGLPVERVRARQMLEGMGDRKGGYYPMMYDRLESKTGEIQISDSVGKLLDPSYRKATTNDGYRQSRVEQFAAPVDFDIDRLGNHMSSMIQDLAYRRWLVDANKITGDATVKNLLKNHLGEEYMNVPREWLKRVINDSVSPSDQSLASLNGFMGALRRNATIVALAGRASTFFVHALSFGGPLQEVGALHLMSGLKQFYSAPAKMWKYVTEVSPEMKHFAESSNTHIQQNIQELGTKTGFKASVEKLMYATVGFANMLRAVPTWLGAKEKAVVELAREGKEGAELERLSLAAADRAVRLSIGAGGAGDVSPIMSKNNQAWRLITMFHTPGSILFAQLRKAGHDIGQGKNVAGTLFKTVVATSLAATVHQLVKGRMPDEAKDETYGGWWLKNQVEYPFSAVPLGHEIATGVVDLVNGQHPQDFKFTPLGAAVDDNFKALEAAGGLAAGEKEWDEFLFKALKASGYWVGAPTGQLSITGDYLYDLMNGTSDPNDLGEFAHDLLFSRQKDRR